jgi:hypothetical protein
MAVIIADSPKGALTARDDPSEISGSLAGPDQLPDNDPGPGVPGDPQGCYGTPSTRVLDDLGVGNELARPAGSVLWANRWGREGFRCHSAPWCGPIESGRYLISGFAFGWAGPPPAARPEDRVMVRSRGSSRLHWRAVHSVRRCRAVEPRDCVTQACERTVLNATGPLLTPWGLIGARSRGSGRLHQLGGGCGRRLQATGRRVSLANSATGRGWRRRRCC